MGASGFRLIQIRHRLLRAAVVLTIGKRVRQRDFRQLLSRITPAVIVGDKNTFGKARANDPSDRRFASLLGSHSDEDGALKLTIKNFIASRRIHTASWRCLRHYPSELE